MSHLRAIRAVHDCAGRSDLAWVPDVARRLGASSSRLLLEADRAGVLELRPESGLGRLSAEDAKRCPRMADGTPLSWVRLR